MSNIELTSTIQPSDILNTKQLITTEIKEEEEPCSIHELIGCQPCKKKMSDKVTQVLKRSISQNAISGIGRRNSVSSIPRLRKTISQTSLYSTGSTQSANLKNDSFNEFCQFMYGEEQVQKMNSLWDQLPTDTKNIFIAKAVQKKKKPNSKLEYKDIKALYNDAALPSKNPYVHYRNKLGPHIRNASPGIKEQTVSKIVGELYNNELSEHDKELLKFEAQQYFHNVLKYRVEKADKYVENTLERAEYDKYLEEITSWKENAALTGKIRELNELLERLESISISSPLTTKPPVDNKKDTNEKTAIVELHGTKKEKHEKNTSSHNTKPNKSTSSKKTNISNDNNSFLKKFTKNSHKFVRRFKRSKKPASLELYREPIPEMLVAMNKQKQSVPA